MRYKWTELALLQLQTGNTAMLVLVLAVILVFLVLAAQYESWSLPLAVILVVPMCLLCSIAAVQWARLDVNIFTQVGFVVLIGLACKNAILVVEFAGPTRCRQGPVRGHARRLQPATAADRDDLVCLYPRRRSLGSFRGSRLRDAPHAGHGRLRRHARRHAVRHLPDAGLLLHDRMGQRRVAHHPYASSRRAPAMVFAPSAVARRAPWLPSPVPAAWALALRKPTTKTAAIARFRVRTFRGSLVVRGPAKCACDPSERHRQFANSPFPAGFVRMQEAAIWTLFLRIARCPRLF